MCVSSVLLVNLLLYVQQSAAQIITDRDKGIVFDYYGEKRLSLSNDTANVKNKSVTVQDKMDCVFACINVSWCRSVNFQTTPFSNGVHLCELLSLDQLNNTKYLNESNNFQHYSTKVYYLQTLMAAYTSHNSSLYIYYLSQLFKPPCHSFFFVILLQ